MTSELWGNPITLEDYRGEVLQGLFTETQDIEILPKPELLQGIQTLIDSNVLTTLGKEFFENTYDAVVFTEPPPNNVEVAHSLQDAKGLIVPRLAQTKLFYAYITGGLDGGFHHLYALNQIELEPRLAGAIIGLEAEDYTRSGGREPLFTLSEKASIWRYIGPENSILFPMPNRPQIFSPDEYYDWVVYSLGLYRNRKVIFAGSDDDTFAVTEARESRAYSKHHVLNLPAVGKPPVHISELIKRPKLI